MSSYNSLIRPNDIVSDAEITQNPCYLGIYVTDCPTSAETAQLSANGTENTIKCHCVTIHPVSSKIGYVEWLDSPSLLLFRSLLLQEQPTDAIIFTSHGLDGKKHPDLQAKMSDPRNMFTKNEASGKVVDSIENEFILSNCPVDRIPLLKEWTEMSNIKNILAYIFPPHAISDSMSDSTDLTTSTTKEPARAMYSREEINRSYNLCQTLLNATSTELQYTSPIMIGLVYKIINQFITTAIKEQAIAEHQLGGSSALNRSKLIKLRQNALQLPTKYLFYVTSITTSLRIDQNTLTSLGVLPTPTDAHKSMSLFGLLNNCQTAFGSRLLLSWIKQPLLDIYQINQRQLVVQTFISNPSTIKSIRNAMKGVPDVEKVLTKLNKTYSQTSSGQRKITSIVSNEIIKECVNLFHFVGQMKALVSTLSSIIVNTNTSVSGEGTAQNETLVDENDLYQFTTLHSELPPETPDGEPILVPYTVSTLLLDKLLTSSVNMTPEHYTNIRYTRELNKLLHGLHDYERLITTTIDFEALARHEFLIKGEVSPELSEVAKRKGKIFRALERLHLEVLEELCCDAKTVKMLHTSANDIGYYFRVTRRDEKLIRDKSAIYQVIESRKDGVRFTTNNFKKLSQEYQDQIEQYQTIQYETCVQLLDTAMTYCADFYALMGLVAELDVLAAFAHTATLSQKAYIRPQLISPQSFISIGPQYIEPHQRTKPDPIDSNQANTGQIRLINARHPCLEVQPGVQYIPNNVDLQHGVSELQLITGPNMGGKSSYLRSAALVVLMAQIGSFVPCDEASIYLVDCILARVGAGDVQLKGISTFMKEMIETSEILNYATSNSLIIIDELGRGTSTYDGFGLAWGIAEYLTKKIHSYTLFATHFHEMTSMVNEISTVKNKHVTAHTGNNTITMLYKIQDGFCDRSFGIHVAEMANFPPQVITIARQKANELEEYANENTVQLAVPITKEITTSTSTSTSVSDTAMNDTTISTSSDWQSKLGNMDDSTEIDVKHKTNANQVELALVKLQEQTALNCIDALFKDPQLLSLMATLDGMDDTNAPQNWSTDQINMVIPAYNNVISSISK